VSYRKWQLRVQDILNAIEMIESQTRHLSFEEFQENEILVKAVLYDFIVIGEAAIRVDADVQQRYPQIPWRLMGDLRNVVAHQYFQVNFNIIWNTIRYNFPPLVSQLAVLLAENLEEQE